MSAAAPTPDPNVPIYTALIGAGAALAGVIIAGIIAAIRSRAESRSANAWRLYDDRRAHLEQVYEALEQVRESYGYLILQAEARARAQQLPGFEVTKIPWARLLMLANLYVPDLLPAIKAVERVGTQQVAIACADALIEGSSDPKTAARLTIAIREASAALHTAVTAASDQIIAESARLAAETQNRSDKWLTPDKARAAKPIGLTARLKRWPWTSG